MIIRLCPIINKFIIFNVFSKQLVSVTRNANNEDRNRVTGVFAVRDGGESFVPASEVVQAIDRLDTSIVSRLLDYPVCVLKIWCSG